MDLKTRLEHLEQRLRRCLRETLPHMDVRDLEIALADLDARECDAWRRPAPPRTEETRRPGQPHFATDVEAEQDAGAVAEEQAGAVEAERDALLRSQATWGRRVIERRFAALRRELTTCKPSIDKAAGELAPLFEVLDAPSGFSVWCRRPITGDAVEFQPLAPEHVAVMVSGLMRDEWLPAIPVEVPANPGARHEDRLNQAGAARYVERELDGVYSFEYCRKLVKQLPSKGPKGKPTYRSLDVRDLILKLRDKQISEG